MKLVFVNPLSKNYKGETIYEFIFTDSNEIEAGDDWAVTPASSGIVTPPPVEEIAMVGTLTSNLELDLAMRSDYFSYNDAIEKIVAIAWQTNHADHEDRLVFHVEDDIEDVKAKLYAKDLKLVIQNLSNNDD